MGIRDVSIWRVVGRSGLIQLTFRLTLIVCMINNHGQQEKTRALMEYKLDELTKRVEKHNSVVERTYILEEKMKVANHRIDDLERKAE